MHSPLKPQPKLDTRLAHAQVHFLLCSDMPRPGLADLFGAYQRGGLLGTGARSRCKPFQGPDSDLGLADLVGAYQRGGLLGTGARSRCKPFQGPDSDLGLADLVGAYQRGGLLGTGARSRCKPLHGPAENPTVTPHYTWNLGCLDTAAYCLARPQH